MVRPRFDPTRDFEAGVGFIFHGKRFTKGDPFPKEGVSSQKLSAMYDARRIKFESEDTMRRDPQQFDATRALLMATTALVHGHELGAATPLKIVDAESDEAGEIMEPMARRLWAQGKADYAEDVRPTPVETPQEAAKRQLAIEDAGGGWFHITAPWLAEPVKVQGQEAANDRLVELIEAGVPEEAPGEGGVMVGEGAGDAGGATDEPSPDFTVTEAGSNGWYEVTGPGMDKPEKVQGKAKAEERAAALKAAYKPEDQQEG